MMRLTLVIVALLIASSAAANFKRPNHFLSDDFIARINKKAKTWKARRNFHEDTPLEELKIRLGYLSSGDDDTTSVREVKIPKNFVFEENFDGREKWANCPTLSEVRDQGACGSCWAFATAEVMSDRTCIHSEGKINHHYSAEDILSCCTRCGLGCEGGYMDRAFAYWKVEGVVSGGGYQSGEGCRPYSIPSSGEMQPTPTCLRKCQKDYNVTYEDDKRYGVSLYRLHGSEKEIKYELSTNGPVGAGIAIYEDFYNYDSGVYHHVEGDLLGYHAIKIIGYGVENDAPYWLIANSWGNNWGEKGFFKIWRDESNHCQIMDKLWTALPKVD